MLLGQKHEWVEIHRIDDVEIESGFFGLATIFLLSELVRAIATV